jgi:predicted O-methyltransferase YrrM
MNYNLSHLTQSPSQDLLGPIQDDEALVLYSIIRAKRLKTIVEIGGLSGYSAKNFLEATNGGTVITIDINQVPNVGDGHRTIIKSAESVNSNDIGNPIDLVFFDCHHYNASLSFFNNMVNDGLITDNTVLALHDTGLHYYKVTPQSQHNGEGWVHQPVERNLVNHFFDLGYQVFHIQTTPEVHNDSFPFRHGLTLCTKFKKFNN